MISVAKVIHAVVGQGASPVFSRRSTKAGRFFRQLAASPGRKRGRLGGRERRCFRNAVTKPTRPGRGDRGHRGSSQKFGRQWIRPDSGRGGVRYWRGARCVRRRRSGAGRGRGVWRRGNRRGERRQGMRRAIRRGWCGGGRPQRSVGGVSANRRGAWYRDGRIRRRIGGGSRGGSGRRASCNRRGLRREMTMEAASRPCLRALKRETDLPSTERGPVDFWALARLAVI